MKLSKLYSNQPTIFEPVNFSSGLNVIMGEIRVPENRDKDTHNLGKSTFGALLDFCFLAKRNRNQPWFKHQDRFEEFVFFLEIQLAEESFITVRRGVKDASKASFKKHSSRYQDFSSTQDDEWDHLNLPFDRAKAMLDGQLDLQGLKPWDYRKTLGYHLRSQSDYSDVFQLHKFKGSDSAWKPTMAHIFGFDADIITAHYEKETQLEQLQTKEKNINSELGDSIQSLSKIEGLLLLKKDETQKKQAQLNAFDFRNQDKEHTKNLVDSIDKKIAALNAERYSLNFRKKKIISSLEGDKILFDPDEAQSLFSEVGIYFDGQLKKDYQQLIEFNKAITDERQMYLEEELSEIKAELSTTNSSINQLSKQRSKSLAFLSDTDVFNKYKKLSDEMVDLRASIKTFEHQQSLLRGLQSLRSDIRKIESDLDKLQTQIEDNVEQQNSEKDSLFSEIRLFFNEIVEEVTGQKAILTASPNSNGHLDFNAEFVDDSGTATSAAKGFSYKKFLCIAFDLAVLRAHLKVKFPRFVYLDGFFEALDSRKKEKLLNVLRDYADLGIQFIVTLIDTDLPPREVGERPVFKEEEIVLTLHDENEKGLLFKMKPW